MTAKSTVRGKRKLPWRLLGYHFLHELYNWPSRSTSPVLVCQYWRNTGSIIQTCIDFWTIKLTEGIHFMGGRRLPAKQTFFSSIPEKQTFFSIISISSTNFYKFLVRNKLTVCFWTKYRKQTFLLPILLPPPP